MSHNLPTRKFDVTPVSVQTKTTKAARQLPAGEHDDDDDHDELEVRKFAGEPVGQRVNGSTAAAADVAEKTDEKPIITRRYIPEVIEETAKNSKTEREKSRIFSHEAVKDFYKSSKNGSAESGKSKQLKFAPQPIETIHRTNRKPKEIIVATPPRKFVPILLDTAKRSRRAGDSSSGLTSADKTEAGYVLLARENRKHIMGQDSPFNGVDIHMPDADQHAPTRHIVFASGLKPRLPLKDGDPRPLPVRKHSFVCPDLATIESSESDPNSSPSSLSNSPGVGSPITGSDSSFFEVYKHATRVRETIDEKYTHYLMQLEAKQAQERLQDEALAAFPNVEKWDNVPHFVNAEDDSDDMEMEDRPATVEAARRDSAEKINFDQLELQRYAEKMQQERNVAQTTARHAPAPTAPSPWWNAGNGAAIGANPDSELRSMRDRARPPMLGADIAFPRCPSPLPARFDVTQGSAMLRNQMSHLNNHLASQSSNDEDDDAGLWQAVKSDASKPFVSVPSPAPKPASNTKGLWGGFCVDDGSSAQQANTGAGGRQLPRKGPSGIITPPSELATDPFNTASSQPAPDSSALTRTTSRTKPADLNRIDSVLAAEQALEAEYPDSFVTQVYNYLSLGYPSLARPFDEELAKISRVPLAELRQDDRAARASPRGYIKLGEDFEGGGGEGGEQGCVRWRALRGYIREWARQERGMVAGNALAGSWGTGARRGSWAF